MTGTTIALIVDEYAKRDLRSKSHNVLATVARRQAELARREQFGMIHRWH
jgi:hypothetical protein